MKRKTFIKNGNEILPARVYAGSGSSPFEKGTARSFLKVHRKTALVVKLTDCIEWLLDCGRSEGPTGKERIRTDSFADAGDYAEIASRTTAG